MRTAQFVLPAMTLAFGVVLAAAPLEIATVAPKAFPEELWIEPTDLEQRDLFQGPGDGPPPPTPETAFTFVKKDTTGRSPGYDVRDANGTLWSVKLGPEAQPEVVASHLLWSIGFHQPPTFYLSKWTLTGGGEGTGPQEGGRFRPEVPGWKVTGDWKWDEGPLAQTRAMKGLLVAMMMINNWDLKSSNNKVYEITDSASGPRTRYVSRDLGASFGSNEQSKWVRWLGLRTAQGSKNDLAGFLESGFIDSVKNNRVTFEYSGPNKPLVSNISAEEVRWTATLMSRLSDQQWQDAFRAGDYSPEDANRFIAKFKEKIATGLALP
jgi:hypothetical protein